MNLPVQTKNSATTLAIEIAIRLGVIFLILVWCLQILTPFIGLVAWGAIIAVAIYKPFQKLVAKLGGRKKLAVTLIVVGSIAAVLIPVISLSSSMIESATTISTEINEGRIDRRLAGNPCRIALAIWVSAFIMLNQLVTG